jgi:TatD DNase family protein
MRGKPNEPAYLRHIAEGLAECFECGLEEVAAASTRNTKAFFNLP